MKTKSLPTWGLLIVVVLVAGYLLSTRGGMGEYSPYTMEYRTRRELTLFWGTVPIYRSRYQTHENEVLEFLQSEGYVTSVPAPESRWSSVFHWNQAWNDGYGSSYRTLIRNRQSTIAWCEEDPDRARYFWSETFRLMRSSDPSEQLAGELLFARFDHLKSREEIKDEVERWLEYARAK